MAKSLLEKDHMIKGVSVHIGAAKPKGGRNDSAGGGGRYGDRDGGGGGHYGGDRDGGHHGSFGSWQRHPFERATERQYDPFRDRWM